ncbi:MAG: TPM domain-containing protein [Lachnospiraceae bacterium]|nr:TPM domain-containing protein [Lachnospiraceae bacterium]
MRKKGMLFLLFLLLLLPSREAMAVGVRLSDSAGLLTTQEASVAEKNLNYIVERYDVSVRLFTSDSIGKKDDYKAYVEKQRKKDKDKNLLLLFVSTKKNEEICFIKADGTAKENLTEKRLSRVEREVERNLLKADYKEAVHVLSGQLLEKMGTKPVFDAFVFRSMLHFILCVFLTIGGLYLLLRRPDLKKAPSEVPYLSEKYSTLLGTLDHFSHTSVKAVKKKKPPKKKKGEQEEDEFSELGDD